MCGSDIFSGGDGHSRSDGMSILHTLVLIKAMVIWSTSVNVVKTSDEICLFFRNAVNVCDFGVYCIVPCDRTGLLGMLRF